MNITQRRQMLRARIGNGQTLLVPGAYDAVSAKLIERAGFEAVYMGSYAAAAALGLADVGLLTMTEMVNASRAVADSVGIPVIADAEDGWNAAANIWRTVQEFERAGVSAIHIEDHAFGKHTSVPAVLAPTEVVVGKIKAAVAARGDPDFMIIARSDAPWATGDWEDVIRRMEAYAEAGADILMPAGARPDVLKGIRHRIPGKVMVTDAPGKSIKDQQEAGADVVLYYGFTLYAAYGGVASALEQLKATGAIDGIAGIAESIGPFEAMMGYDTFAARHRKFGAD